MVVGFHTVISVDCHGTALMSDDSRQMFESDHSGCLRVYLLVIEGLTETVSSCPKNYQPQSLDVLFALMRSASKVPGDDSCNCCLVSYD